MTSLSIEFKWKIHKTDWTAGNGGGNNGNPFLMLFQNEVKD